MFRRAFWAGLILLIVPIALAVITPNPPTISGFPTQTTPSINLDITWATTASSSGTGTITFAGIPPGVTTVPPTVTYPYAVNSTSATTSFQFAIGASTVPGTYPITMRDASPNNAGTGNITLIVNTPSYTASAAPNPVTLVIGGNPQTVTVTTTADPGLSTKQIQYTFSGFPNFILFGGPQATNNPAYPPVSFSFSLGPGAVAGTYAGNLTGTDDVGNVKNFPYRVVVQQPDIGASFSNPSINVCEGGAAVNDTIDLVPLMGYTGTPRLSFTSVPPGIIVNPLNPPANAMPPGQSVPFTVRASGAAAGLQMVTLNISDPAANINKNITLNVTVTNPDYTPSTVPGSVDLVSGGGGQSITASISPNSCFNAASVSVIPSGQPPGITFNPPSASLMAPGYAPATFVVQAASGVAPGSYPVTFTFRPSTGTPKTTTVTINVAAGPDFRLTVTPNDVSVPAGQSTSVTVTATGVNGFGGTVTVNSPNLRDLTFSPMTFTLPAGGSQVVMIAAASTAVPSTQIGVFSGTAPGIPGTRTAAVAVTIAAGPDFTLTVTPPAASIAASQSIMLAVGVTPINGFTGIVTVTAPNSPNLTFNPPTFMVPAGGSQMVTVTALPGTAPMTFTGVFSGVATGVNGPRTAPVTITITAAPDFTLEVMPSSVTIAQAGSTTVTVNATALNGFTGPITVNSLPSAGVTVNPPMFTLIPGTPQMVNVSILSTAPTGGGNVVFSGVAAGVSGPRTATLSISVSARPDFSLAVMPTSISIPLRGSGTAVVTVVASNAFIGGVLITGAAPAGVTLNPSTFTLTPGQMQTVRIDVGAMTILGMGVIRFTGTSGSLTHTADLLLNVTPQPPVITSVVAPAVATGDRSIVIRLNGLNFQPGARVAVVNPGVRIENVRVITPQIADVTLSVNADAAPGATTITLTNPDNGSAGAVLLVYPRGSIAAPLGVTTAAIIFPAEGTLVAPTQKVFPRGLLSTTGTGTLIGVWKFDGVPFDRFTVNVGGGYPAEVRTHLPLPISYSGGHTLELQIESPQFAVAPALHVVMAAASVSRLTLLAPRDGAVISRTSPPFRWSLVPNSSGYELEMYDFPGEYASKGPKLPIRMRMADAEWKPTAETLQQLGPGIHHWRVRAVFPGETEGEPTEWQRFAILPQNVAIMVERPQVDAATGRTRIRWTGGFAGLLYRLEVLNTSGQTVFSALTSAHEYLLPSSVSGASVRVTALGPGGVTLGVSPPITLALRSSSKDIVLVQQRPTVVSQQPPNGARIQTIQPKIAATWSGTARAEDVSLMLDQTDVTAVSIVTPTSITYDSLLPLDAGSHTVSLSLAGAVTTWTFDIVEGAAPGAQPPTPPPSTLRKDWAVTPNGTVTVISGDAPGQTDDARMQLSAQTDLANDANGAKVTGDMSIKHELNSPNVTVQESRNWLTDFNRQQGQLKGEAKIGYHAPDFLDQSELLATGIARGGVEGRVHFPLVVVSGYETFGTKPAGVVAGDFGPKQTIRAASLQSETNPKWDFRLVGFRVTDQPGFNSAGGLGKAVGIFAKYILNPMLTAIVEGARGSFEPNPESAQTKREGSALRLDLSGVAGTLSYVLNLRRTEANYVNPANRGFTPGGVPDRTGANLSLTKVISKTSVSLQLRTLRDGNSSGAILPRNRENGGTLAIATSIGPNTTLALGGNWTGDRGSGNPTLGLPDLDRNQSGANGTLTEAIGRFSLSQAVTVQKLRDRINPISDQTTTGTTFTFGGAVVPNINLSAVLSGTRSEGSSAVGTNDQYLASLQPSFTIPKLGVMFQPRANYSRSKNNLTNLESRTEQYQGLATWSPPWKNSFLSVQVSADASRNRSTGQIAPAKFIHQYVGTMTLKWGAGSGAAMNGTTVVDAPADQSATKTNDPSTTASISQ